MLVPDYEPSRPESDASSVELPVGGLQISSLRLSKFVPFVVIELTNPKSTTTDIMLTIDGPFTVGDQRDVITPPRYDPPCLDILGRMVTRATASTQGLLTIDLDDGNQLIVAPQPDGEAWQLDNGDNLLVVSLPGGGLHESSQRRG